MVNDTDNPDEPANENENLVKALESIKSLLATSETKLSQARESINRASAQSLKTPREIPVLDEVIIPGKQLGPEKPTAPPKTEPTAEKEQKPESGAKADLHNFQIELEKEMQRKLAAYAAELELELKAKIHNYLSKNQHN